MSVIRCKTCDRNIDLDVDSTHIEDCKWEAGQGCGKSFIDCFVFTLCNLGSLCPDCREPPAETGEEE